jgi:hypothetical protein
MSHERALNHHLNGYNKDTVVPRHNMSIIIESEAENSKGGSMNEFRD